MDKQQDSNNYVFHQSRGIKCESVQWLWHYADVKQTLCLLAERGEGEGTDGEEKRRDLGEEKENVWGEEKV